MRRSRDQGGQVAGVEAVPFGILVFVGLVLAVVNAWGVVNARSVADSAAREYLRVYTQAPSRAAGLAQGGAAARRVLAGHDLRGPVRIEEPAEFAPCAVTQVVVRIEVPAVRVPFLGGLGRTEVSARQRGRMDPYRVRSAGDAASLDGTVCDGS